MAFSKTSENIIVADVGGTNGRFAVASVPKQGTPEILVKKTYACASFAHLADMLGRFVAEHETDGIQEAHLALAGDVTESAGRITNIGWSVEAPSLEKATGLRSIRFMNDFAAVASAIPLLGPDRYIEIKPGNAAENAPISTMGPGTGFGVALLVPFTGGYRVVPTEGGHIAFAPATQLEHDLLKHLKKTSDHVCVESLLSGRGLVRIHDFLVGYAGSGQAGLGPADITREAATLNTPSCVRAVQVFLSILGAVAGDLALAHGARGGIWIAGGIVPKICDFIADSDLVLRFSAKGMMAPYLSDIPINLVTDTDAALIGAAAAWREKALHRVSGAGPMT